MVFFCILEKGGIQFERIFNNLPNMLHLIAFFPIVFVEVADPSAEISFKVDLGVKFVFPHPPNSGNKPVFERDGVRRFFNE